jgi:uncharacterized membrane-anchored protein
MKHGRIVLLWVGLLLALGVANRGIFGHERTLSEGRVLLLELAPVDPRSLMQGDYMALQFAAADEVRKALDPGDDRHELRLGMRGSAFTELCGDDGCEDGYAVFARDRDDVGRFLRIQRAPAPLARDEIAVRFRERAGSRIRIASDAWFFPEGRGERYAEARYGELRVAEDGTALLTGLRDEARRPL